MKELKVGDKVKILSKVYGNGLINTPWEIGDIDTIFSIIQYVDRGTWYALKKEPVSIFLRQDLKLVGVEIL